MSTSTKVFLVTVGMRFLASDGGTCPEYPDAKGFSSEAAALKFAKRHVEATGKQVLFEVWEHDAYAAGGEPCHVEYDRSQLSEMECAGAQS